MSETPETDAAAMDGTDGYGYPLKPWDYKASKDGEVVPAEFARRIERERDEARRDLVASEELHRRRFGTLKEEVEQVMRERDEARSERDEARKVARMAYIRLGLKFMGDAIKRWEEEK